MACGQMIKTRKGLLKTLKNFREKKKVRGRSGVDVSDLNNDIKSVVIKLEQIDRDIRECTKKGISKNIKESKKKENQKQQKHQTKPIKLKPINASLDVSVNEKPHGTGNRGAYFTK